MTDTRYTDAATGREWVREDVHKAAMAEARREALRDAANELYNRFIPRNDESDWTEYARQYAVVAIEARRFTLALIDAPAPASTETHAWDEEQQMQEASRQDQAPAPPSVLEAVRWIKLIRDQDQGCGGNLRPDEIYHAMQRTANEALRALSSEDQT